MHLFLLCSAALSFARSLPPLSGRPADAFTTDTEVEFCPKRHDNLPSFCLSFSLATNQQAPLRCKWGLGIRTTACGWRQSEGYMALKWFCALSNSSEKWREKVTLFQSLHKLLRLTTCAVWHTFSPSLMHRSGHNRGDYTGQRSRQAKVLSCSLFANGFVSRCVKEKQNDCRKNRQLASGHFQPPRWKAVGLLSLGVG